jgi:hypothetical protein
MNIAEASPKGLEHFWQKPQMRGDRKSDRQMTNGVPARRLPCSAMATAPRKWLSFMETSQDHQSGVPDSK